MSIKRAVVAVIVITLVILNIKEWRGKGIKAYCKAFLSVVPANLLFVITCILYFPSSIVITNKDEYEISLSYGRYGNIITISNLRITSIIPTIA